MGDQHLKVNYQIGKTVGCGGFCKVKLATHIPTGEQVAIKIFDKQALIEEDGEESLAKLLEENNVLGRMRNDHVVQLYEVIDTADIMYIVMEYASGGELFDYIIAHGHLEEYEACSILHQILHSLEYVHRHNVVHRDLKPENLLLDKERMIKLIDFGLADEMKDGRRLEGLEHGGSPSYLAPEVIIDDEDVPIDYAVDIWSLGVVLYALLAGALPFSGETVEDEDGCPEEDLNSLFQAIVTGEYTVPDFVSEDAKELLDGMLTADPTERLTAPQIRETRWYQRFIDGDDEAGASEKAAEVIRPEILEEMKQTTKYDTAEVRRFIEEGNFSAGTAHYALLCKKRDRAAPNERHQPVKADKSGAADGANGAQVAASFRIGEPIAAQYSHRTVSAQVQHRQGTVSHAHLKDAEEALVEIEATLGEMGIKWKKNGVMDIMCTDENRGIVFELRIDDIEAGADAESTHKLRVNRIQGDIWEYKQLTRQLLTACTKSLALHHITNDETTVE